MRNKTSSFFGKLFGGNIKEDKEIGATTSDIAKTLSDLSIDPGLVAKLNIESTPKTPKISYDPATKTLSIEGRSIPENSAEFWKPIIDQLKLLPKGSLKKVNFFLEYFNSSSSKCLFDLLKDQNGLVFSKNPITIVWKTKFTIETIIEMDGKKSVVAFVDDEHMTNALNTYASMFTNFPHIQEFLMEIEMDGKKSVVAFVDDEHMIEAGNDYADLLTNLPHIQEFLMEAVIVEEETTREEIDRKKRRGE